MVEKTKREPPPSRVSEAGGRRERAEAELDGLVHRIRPPDREPHGALVLFHGRGADEHDLLPLLDALDPARRLVGIAPRGPLSLPPGGAHWYAVRRVGHPDPDSFRAVFERTAAWLDALPDALGVALDSTVIGGFSQGAVMSYSLGLGRGRPAPAGIIALSGFMPTVEGFGLDLDRRRGLPVAIGHGSYDPVIGPEWGRDARDRLEAAGAAVTFRESPMQHAIDPRFLAELVGWVADATGAPRTT